MADFKDIVDATKRIETILVEKFGATGRGLHEKLSSVEDRVPFDLHAAIRYVATIRNKAMHEDGFELAAIDQFLRQAQFAHESLQRATVQPRSLLGRLRAFKVEYLTPRNAGAAAAVVVALVLAMPRGSGRGPREMPPTAESKQLAAEILQGKNGALANSALAIEVIEFSYQKDHWGRLAPHLVVRARNLSDRTVSFANLDAQLYIDGNTEPVVTAVESVMPSSNLLVHFTETGLAAGAVTDAQVSFGMDDNKWTVPDVLNAKVRTIALRVATTYDGMDHPFGEAAPPFAKL